MILTRFVLSKRRVAAVGLVFLALFGISVFDGISREEDPPFIIRAATISTQFPGASAERVESLITDPLEREIRGMPELDFISFSIKW